MGFIFKGDFDLGAVSLDLTVADNQVTLSSGEQIMTALVISSEMRIVGNLSR